MHYIESSLTYKKQYYLVAGSGRATERGILPCQPLGERHRPLSAMSDFFTIKTAYEFIINNCPSRLDKSILQSCDINNYLTENISYAADMSGLNHGGYATGRIDRQRHGTSRRTYRRPGRDHRQPYLQRAPVR